MRRHPRRRDEIGVEVEVSEEECCSGEGGEGEEEGREAGLKSSESLSRESTVSPVSGLRVSSSSWISPAPRQ